MKRRPWAAAVGTAALTGLLFVVVYNVCNQLTHLRPDVGVWAFSWERFWPLVPVMIVPYWSIDLLFMLAPFLVRDEAALRTFRRRIVFVICGAALGFLLIPLRFAFPRPVVDGELGPWFRALYTFDFPHNLFPSLHIALRTVLTEHYLRHTPRRWRWPVHVWFSLVGFSTLLTWQHHLVDVLGGFWLALIAIHLFPVGTAPLRAANRRVAGIYAVVAVVCSQLARLSWPWTFPFVWPMFTFGAAAFAYCGHGSFYYKRDGQLTFVTKLLFGPLLAAQWLSWRHYRGQSARCDRLTPQVWLGPVLTETEARDTISAGVTAVLDLTAEFSAPQCFRNTNYLNVPVLDLTAPTPEQLAEAVAFIGRETERGIVFIHCKAGYSRTACVAAAWLLSQNRETTPEMACSELKRVRPRIVIRPEIHRALDQFAAARGNQSGIGVNRTGREGTPN